MTAILANPQGPVWDAYLAGKSDSVFCHRFVWGETLASAYRLPILRLAAMADTPQRTISGILPLLLFAAPGRDIRLISLPYSDSAGIVADDCGIARQLLTAALDRAMELGAVHVELRQAGEVYSFLSEPDCDKHWTHSAHTFKVGLRRSLPETPAELWSLLPAKIRNQVRKARKSGCTVKTGGRELLDDFYAVFSENMRDLGSPVHAPAVFRLLLEQSALKTRVITVYLETMPVAAAMVFEHNSTLFNPWASSLRRFRPSSANTMLYWAMLELAVACSCRWFDFGRSSPDAATCSFKRHWGALPQPLTWHVFSRRNSTWAPGEESLVLDSWKSLELESSRRDGPAIRRWISL